tara:strand:+ start:1308 stop:1694 length:387 start_codon:yes stop_codon:yes gene_type:complete
MAHADDATKTWVSAIPTKNADGNVTEWKIKYRYTLTVGTEKGNVMQTNGKYNDDFIKTFEKTLVIENPSKAPNAYTKSELLSFKKNSKASEIGTHLNEMFNKKYAHHIANQSTITTDTSFDVSSLNDS